MTNARVKNVLAIPVNAHQQCVASAVLEQKKNNYEN